MYNIGYVVNGICLLVGGIWEEIVVFALWAWRDAAKTQNTKKFRRQGTGLGTAERKAP